MAGDLVASTKGRRITPLTIILSFILLVEAVVMGGVVSTGGNVQIILTIFCALFPILIGVPFFFILYSRPWVFYAPHEYGMNIEPSAYISAVSRETYLKASENTSKFIEELPARIVNEVEKLGDDRKFLIEMGNSSTEGRNKILDDLSTSIKSSWTIEVDLSYFGGEDIYIPVGRDLSVSDFLDFVYFQISAKYYLEPFTYGTAWWLVERDGEREFKHLGRAWAMRSGQSVDTRPLGEVGIFPGMRLKAVGEGRMSARFSN